MSSSVPPWLEASLSREEISRIEQAVKDAELRTSAEIVPMIVHRSTLKATGDRILFWICFGILGVGGAVSLSLMGGLDEALLDRFIDYMGLWPTAGLHLTLASAAELAVALAAFGIAWAAAWFFSRFDRAHRFVFPKRDLAIEAEHRAQAEFFASDLRSTTGRTGVLLFVSMLERRAVILADEAIVAKFAPATWTDVLASLVGAIRNGQMGSGYTMAIKTIGEHLERHFPIASDDKNELSNKLRISE